MATTRVRLATVILTFAIGGGVTASQATDSSNQAEFHYRIALAALKDNNFEIAFKELEQAANLAPSNALIHYNLAVVLQKKGQPTRALESLDRAVKLGMPEGHREAANDLLATLTYEKQKLAAVLIGYWFSPVPAAGGQIGMELAFDSAGGFGWHNIWRRGQSLHIGTVTGSYRVTDAGLILTLESKESFGDATNNEDLRFLIGVNMPFFPDVSKIGETKELNYGVIAPDTISVGRYRFERFKGETDDQYRKGKRVTPY